MITAKKPETTEDVQRLSLTNKELLERILDSFVDYRKLKQYLAHRCYKIHLKILTYKIIFDNFEVKLGASSDPNCTNYYSRIKYTLSEFTTCEENEFLITPAVEEKMRIYLNGANSTSEVKTAEIQINLEDYTEEKQIVVHRCKLCGVQMQPFEVKPHMKSHTLAEFLELKK